MADLMKGTVVKISGPVVDVRFDGKMPPINSLLTVEKYNKHLEVALHLEQGVVRSVALEATE